MSTDVIEATVEAPSTELAVPTTRDVAEYDPVAKTINIQTPINGMVLEFREGQRTLDAKQMHLLSPLGIEAGWDPNQVAIFLMDCARRGFDPWANEAYLMLYPGGKYVRHTGIYGFRRKGEESGKYRGRIGPEFSADGETWKKVWLDRTTPPAAARCAIIRADHDGPDWGYASYDEFVPMQDETVWRDKRGGGREKFKTGRRVATPMWRSAAEGGKPSVMLGKVAEAIGWRGAFPNRFNGFYVPEEFERQKLDQDDEAAARRRAAYEAATQPAETRERIVVEGTLAEPEQPAPTEEPMPDNARELLLAELDEQAEILGKTVDQMSARWSASRGRPLAQATDAELREFVGRWREFALKALREANREAEAARYAQAPEFGTCQELFGRGPAIPEPPADFDAAQDAA